MSGKVTVLTQKLGTYVCYSSRIESLDGDGKTLEQKSGFSRVSRHFSQTPQSKVVSFIQLYSHFTCVYERNIKLLYFTLTKLIFEPCMHTERVDKLVYVRWAVWPSVAAFNVAQLSFSESRDAKDIKRYVSVSRPSSAECRRKFTPWADFMEIFMVEKHRQAMRVAENER